MDRSGAMFILASGAVDCILHNKSSFWRFLKAKFPETMQNGQSLLKKKKRRWQNIVMLVTHPDYFALFWKFFWRPTAHTSSLLILQLNSTLMIHMWITCVTISLAQLKAYSLATLPIYVLLGLVLVLAW